VTVPAPAGDRASFRSRFRDRLLAAWYARKRTPLSLALAPLSWLFAAIVAIRRASYRSGLLRVTRIGVPVVVVGNITVGGSGKTPLVIGLAHALSARGRRPGIVSRGHGGKNARAREVTQRDSPDDVGDEPLLLAATGFPVWIGRDRAAAARSLVVAHPSCDVVICDDGLQHYALSRDVEIAAVDASRSLGNGCLLPAGPLREPASRLATVDAVVELVDSASARATTRAPRVFTMTHDPIGWRNLVDPSLALDAAVLRRGSVHAVAGTANPQRFFDLVAGLGIEAIPHAFEDHHAFVGADLAFPDAQAILMTAKDAVKCARFADARFFALDIRAVPDAALVDLVLERLDGRQAA
jgi:tetraacyldisaccharide 4'-kinase